MNTGRIDAGLIDVLDRVLDKGVVIDAHVRVALVGVEVLAVEARVVVASIETYLVHADAVSYTGLAARPVGMRDALSPGNSDHSDEPPTDVPPGGTVAPLIAERIDVEQRPPISIENTGDVPEADESSEADDAE